MIIKPMPAHLLVYPIPDTQPSAGIILAPKTIRGLSPYIKALVQDKGTPTDKYPMTEFVRDGQEKVLIPRGAGTEVEKDGVKLRIIHVSEVIGWWSTKVNKDSDYGDAVGE